MRKTIIVLAGMLAFPAYAGDGKIPRNFQEYQWLYNHAAAILSKHRAPPQSQCFSEQGYCINARLGTYNNITQFVGILTYPNGISTSEVCLSPGNITDERRCFASTGAVWDETNNGTLWEITNQISGNWQEGE